MPRLQQGKHGKTLDTLSRDHSHVRFPTRHPRRCLTTAKQRFYKRGNNSVRVTAISAAVAEHAIRARAESEQSPVRCERQQHILGNEQPTTRQ